MYISLAILRFMLFLSDFRKYECGAAMRCQPARAADAQAKAICKPFGLSVRGTGGEHTPIGADGTVDISPSARFCITEAEIVTALYTGIVEVMKAEAGAA